MVLITRSIIVNAPVEVTFDVSNRIDEWSKMIPEYLETEILGYEGRKIWFRLTNQDGATWTSWRMLHRPYIAYAERHDPVAPFEYNHITWLYQGLPGNTRTQMTWDMCFELGAERKHEEEAWQARMAEHTETNQRAMADYIESLTVS